MKNKKSIILTLLILALLPSIFISSGEVTTYKKTYYAVKDSSIVSTRELALLASLVYEDVPDDKNYTTNLGQGCINKDGSLKQNCFFKAYTDLVKSSRNGNPDVYQYIEGMSKDKVTSPVSDATTSLHEDGEKYYYLDFASAKEMEEAGWVIYDYRDEKVSGKIKEFLQTNFKLTTEDFKAVFSAITFKKGNNYVIAYRGTDFPDLFEWIDDFAYAINGQHSEASLAYIYAQDVYRKIVASNPKAKIYVTGHSLGAYLAQIGGAAIIDQEAEILYESMSEGNIKTNKFTKISEYTNHYKPKTSSKLEQVAYFNGMGVGGMIGKDSALVDNVQDALFYLSTHTKNGQVANTGRLLNYSDKTKNSSGIQSSGRLVLYSMDEDPISYLGFHYGEIYKLEPGADAVTNHRGNHNMTAKGVSEFLGNLSSNLKEDSLNLFEKLLGEKQENSFDYDYAKALNEALGGISKFSDALNSGSEVVSNLDASNSFPTIVSSEVKKVSGVEIGNINLFSMLGNLLSGGINSIDKYGLLTNGSFPGIIDFFNINHETDSFACIIDKGNGTLKEVKLTVSSSDSSIACDGSGMCYYNGIYADNGFDEFASLKTNTSKFINKKLTKNVVLKADVEGACAKYYEWQYSDGKNWKTFATTTDNRAVVPASLIKNKTNKYSFRVIAGYGDNFQETKTYFEDNKLLIGHGNSRKKSYSTNPTLREGLTVSNKPVTSNVLTLSINLDVTKPKCTTTTPVEVSLTCSWFKCSSLYKEAVVSCSDDDSGIKNITIDTFEIKQGGLALLPIIKQAGNAYVKDNNVNFPITVLRKPSINTPFIKVKVTVTDKAGNSDTFKKDIKFKIKKAK